MFGKKQGGGAEPTRENVTELLARVHDPVLEKDLIACAMLKDVAIERRSVRIAIELPTPAWEPKSFLEREVRRVVGEAFPAYDVVIDSSANVRASRPETTAGQNLVPGAKNVILFASGKGGVGKSTVATNVAAALARLGSRVGLLDADIYGPSIPTMLGTFDRPEVREQKLIPLSRHGLDVMSIGFIVDPREAMTWRGPMLNGALIQFMRDVEWGELDYMILDLPPGTGDVQLTIAQNVKVSGAVMVSTPQEVALADVIRGKAMFDKVEIPTIGIVENMAYFECGNCKTVHPIFAEGGATRLAKEIGLPVLGRIPLEIGTRESGDSGTPEVLAHPESRASKAFVEIAMRIATTLAKTAASAKKASGLRIVQ